MRNYDYLDRDDPEALVDVIKRLDRVIAVKETNSAFYKWIYGVDGHAERYVEFAKLTALGLLAIVIYITCVIPCAILGWCLPWRDKPPQPGDIARSYRLQGKR